jgi:hypothetical protein
MKPALALLAAVSRIALTAGLLGLLCTVSACRQDSEPPAPPLATTPAEPALFADVTGSSGVKFSYRNGEEAGHYAILETLGGGVALIDYDGDGLLDLFVTGGGYFDRTDAEYKANPSRRPHMLGLPCKLYKNLGGLKFEDVTARVFPQQPGFYTHGVAVTDYDHDGRPDLLVTGYGGVALYRNVPLDPGDPARGCHFVNVTKEAGLAEGILGKHFWATSAAFADLDGDGYPDLYVCQYVNWSWANNPVCDGYTSDVKRDICPPKAFAAVPHALYHNVPADPNNPARGRKFLDVTRPAGIRIGRADENHGKGLGVVIVDVNGDGKPDIYVANDTVDNFLYLNRSRPGALSFEEVGAKAGVAGDDTGLPNGSMGADAGDPFGSGLPALWCTNYEAEYHALYRNLRRGERPLFRFATHEAGIGAIGTAYVGFGTRFVDIDRDGWEDLVIANGHVIRAPRQTTVAQRQVLLLNQGKGQFLEATGRVGPYFTAVHRGRGLAVGDLDNDGRPDLVFSNVNEPVHILRNVAGAGRHWLGVELAGTQRRDLVGACLTLEVGGKKLTRFVKGGGSYLSAHDPRLLFGLGDDDKVGRLTVQWPSGEPRVQHWDGLAVDRYLRLIQGQAAAEPWRPAAPKP